MCVEERVARGARQQPPLMASMSSERDLGEAITPSLSRTAADARWPGDQIAGRAGHLCGAAVGHDALRP